MSRCLSLFAGAVALGLTLASTPSAGVDHGDAHGAGHRGAQPPPAASGAAGATGATGATGAAGAADGEVSTDGEVRRVDLANGKVTLRHGPIRHLDMPAMTMVFTAREGGMLAGLKPGDKVRFVAIHEGGQYLVTEIRPLR